MYHNPVRRRAALGLAGAHARQVSADRHNGPRSEFLRRHEMEAKQAAQGSRRERKDFAKRLLSRASDTRNTMLAIEHCAARGQAAGPNGLRPADLDASARWSLAKELGQLIQRATYRPSDPRTHWIDKGAGRGQRPIRIQNFEDRCTERAVLQVIRPLTESQYLDCSLGFRCPGHSREEALATAERLAADQGRWVWIGEDLKDAFEHVPSVRLMQTVRRMIPADDICDFIGRIATRPRRKGIRQGGPLSPELLNIYLHWTLDRWWQETFPEVPMLRVADDLLILAHADEAERLYRQLAERTQAIGMPLKGAPDTAIRNLESGETTEWLGYRIRRQSSDQGRSAIQASLTAKSWAKLEDHLQLAWEEPIPPLSVNDSIRGWIGQQGAAYCRESVQGAYTGIVRRAREQGFIEIPEREEIASRWYEAYLRDWVPQRREVLLRVRRHLLLADGSADQHSDLATSSRRSDAARPTTAPPQEAPIRREVSLYCDGSCLGPRGVGGWAYLLVETETSYRRHDAGSRPRTTNNRMELTAVIQGLAALPDPTRVHVVIDSDYVYRGITELLPVWIARRWRGRSGRRVANQRLWQRLAGLLEIHDVDCQWVRGHTGHPEHDFVDQLAREAATCAALPAVEGGGAMV